MIVVCNRIQVNPDHAASFEEGFASRAGLVDRMEGFISFQLLRPTKANDPYVVMTFWEGVENFKAWTESPEFKEGHARLALLPSDVFSGHPKIERYEVIQRASKNGPEL